MHDRFLALVLDFLGPTGNIILVVLGIGLVIFVHELGHFLAAKFFKVRVEVFSLGFGQRLWGFTRNGTDYRIAAIPIGGYVKMAGETPGDETTGAQDELMSKPVGQRFIIFSAGVVMNMVLAFVLFPIAFAGGVSFPKPEIGSVVPGDPAWRADLQPGDEVLKVNGRRVYGFHDIGVEVAIGDPAGIPLEIKRAGEVKEISVVPTKDEEEGRFRIGVNPPYRLVVRKAKGNVEDGPAARAGIDDGDRIVAIDGEPIGPNDEPWSKLSFLARATLTVEGARGRREATIVPEVPRGHEEYRIGIAPVANLIAGLRGEAAKPQALAWQVGDRIERVGDQKIFSSDDFHRGVRAALRQTGENTTISITVERGGARHAVSVPATFASALLDDVALKNDLQSTLVRVMPDTPAAEAGLADGLLVQRVNGTEVQSFHELQSAIAKAVKEKAPVVLDVLQDGTARSVTLTPRPAPTDWGLGAEPVEIVRKYDLRGALLAGFDSSYYFLANAYLTLQKILAGQVSSKNLGGIVSISVASYTFAQYGILKLLFFLAILSINLAFINVLPIPVLDGGHLFFLIIEKIKGSPVSQRVMGYSQIVGLVLILALMLYVTYNDILKLLNY